MADQLPAASISKWTGLYRSVDPFAIAPGAFEVADNVVVPGPSLLRPRRGFAPGTSLVGPVAARSLGFYGTAILFTDAATTTSVDAQDAGTLATSYTVPAAWATSVGGRVPRYTDLSLAPPILKPYGFDIPAMTPRSRWLLANGNAYLSTNFGALRVSAPSGGLSGSSSDIAGLQKQPIFSVNNSAVLTGSYLPPDFQVAYRLTLKFTDAAGNLHVSPPADRILFNNSAGPNNPLYPATLDPYVQLDRNYSVLANYGPDWYEDTTQVTVQIWRTAQVKISATVPDSAGDEMFLIAEVPLTSSIWATQYVDTTPDVPWLVNPLYTNPTTGDFNGLGIGNANTPPPAAFDVFTFKGFTYYANTEEVQRLTVQIIGTGSGGIVDGDTVTLGGTTFQFVSHFTTSAIAGNVCVPLFFVGNAYAPQNAATVTQGIEATARALANVIVQQFQNNAYNASGAPFVDIHQIKTHFSSSYATGTNGAPGLVNIARLVPGAPAFTVAPGVGAGRGWAGALVNGTSDPNRQPANLMQSQPNDPESVPPAFTEVVGAKQKPILRGLALRDSCFLFKGGGDGLWRFTDDGSGTLTIGPLDQTVNLVAPETAQQLENAAFCLTDKGVLRITDGGAPENISNDKIQDDLTRLMEYVGPATLASVAFAVAYESERLYILALPEYPNATSCTVQYVYHLNTGAWTRWTLPNVTCGGVSPSTDILYFGRDTSTSGGNVIWVERKALDDSDFQDPGFSSTVPGVGTYTASALVFTGDLTKSYAPGDLIRYSPDSSHSYLLRVLSATWAVGSNQTTVTLDASATWTAGGSFAVLKGIQASLELLPLVQGEPLYEKQWQKVYFFFRRAAFESGSLSFSTEKQQSPVTYTIAGPVGVAWMYDSLGFGLLPWGGPAQNVVLPLALDQAAARSAALTLRIRIGDALAGWELSALRVPYQPTTPRVRQ